MGTKHKTHRCISKEPGYDKEYVRFVRAFSKNRLAAKFIETFGKKGIQELYKKYQSGQDIDVCVFEYFNLT